MTKAWSYDPPMWKLYTENWEFAKHLRARKDVTNSATYRSRKRGDFGWDFIAACRSLKDELLAKSTEF